MADIGNNIFWENHDLTPGRNGAAIAATTPNKLVVQGNLFSGNGPSETIQADDSDRRRRRLQPGRPRPTPDQFGNFTGNPAFVAPFDPRPGADGPGEFFQDANFDLTSASAAIDAALPCVRPALRFPLPWRVRFPAGASPAPARPTSAPSSSRAREASLSVVRSASPPPRSPPAALRLPTAAPSPSATGQRHHGRLLRVVNQSTVKPTDLVISGNGVNASDPAHATSLTWIDAHTVEFMLSGSFNTCGTVNVSIPAGSVQSLDHQTLPASPTRSRSPAHGTSTPTPTTTTPPPRPRTPHRSTQSPRPPRPHRARETPRRSL